MDNTTYKRKLAIVYKRLLTSAKEIAVRDNLPQADQINVGRIQQRTADLAYLRQLGVLADMLEGMAGTGITAPVEDGDPSGDEEEALEEEEVTADEADASADDEATDAAPKRGRAKKTA